MKDIRPDLRERLDAIGKEATTLRFKLAAIEVQEGNLKSLLQREEERFGKFDAASPIVPIPSRNIDEVRSSKSPTKAGTTPLSRLILSLIQEAEKPLTLDELKAAATSAGFDFGAKKPGRVLHWAQVAMETNNVIVKNGQGYKLSSAVESRTA